MSAEPPRIVPVAGDGPIEDEAPASVAALAGHDPAGPWSRYLARQFDLTYLAVVAGAFVAFAMPDVQDRLLEAPEAGIGIASVAAGAFLNALIVGIFGTSLGKRMFALEVVRTDGGDPPGFSWNTVREFKVWFYGLAMGLPVISLIPLLNNFREVKDRQPARYDIGSATVIAHPIGALRQAAATFLSIVVVFGVLAFSRVVDHPDHGDAAGAPPTNWTNPVTGDSVHLPAGWISQEMKAPDGTDLSTFAPGDESVLLYLGAEPASGMSMTDYAGALELNASSQVTMRGRWQSDILWGRSVVQREALTIKSDWPATYTLWRSGNLFWRLIILNPSPEGGPVRPQALPEAKAVLATIR
ncbi:RDD family protein [Antarcticirhabdus aurantiaca]|uniref:RDD family protein n=1 Tax=Antarcticirhabdus aurantiaca TaxID=2606717 RepID=A0ACD4NRT7_9HYPH|nr:RDD family protein [Antarcticirhabdus aurantiaca]WAJ29509.1 RDD family protein [Jeongeuplla avenae]